MSNNTITINGQVFNYSGGNVSIQGKGVFVDGKEITNGMDLGKKIEVHIHGNAGNIDSEGGVTVNGHVQGNVKASGSVKAQDIGSDVKASGSVHANNIGGDVKASGSVHVKSISGSVKASGSVFNR